MTFRAIGRALSGLLSLLTLAALVAGLPVALYILGRGSPVPRRLPSWHQVLAALMRHDNGSHLFLATLRWGGWVAWAVFTLSVLLEGWCALRGSAAPRVAAVSPFQGFAAALVGTAVMGLLPGLHAPRTMATAPPARAAATAPPAPTWHPAGPPGVGDAYDEVVARSAAVFPGRGEAYRGHMYRVEPGDSLWDIAARQLGDGERWHGIWDLNRGRPQPGGGALTDPALIYPGWTLRLPPATTHPHQPAPPPPVRPRHHHLHAVPATPPPPAGNVTPTPAAPAHTHHQPPAAGAAHGRRERPAGVHLPSGGLVGVTLAAAVSAALLAWQLRRRRIAVPRWPIPAWQDEPGPPEPIETLHRAHLRSLAADAAEAAGQPWPTDPDPDPGDGEDGEDGLDEFGAPTATLTPRPAALNGHGPTPAASGTAGMLAAPTTAADMAPPVPPGRPLPEGSAVFATRGGEEAPLEAVARPVLALSGPGAPAAARALLISALAATPPGEVVIPAGDLALLTAGQQAPPVPDVTPGLPDRLTVTPTLDAALTHATHPAGPGAAPVTLIATVGPQALPAARAALDRTGAGVTAVVLGDWPGGTSCRVAASGDILAATSPALAGAAASHLSAGDTAVMLSLLRGAQGHLTHLPPPAPPPPPPPPPAAAVTAAGSADDDDEDEDAPALGGPQPPPAPAGAEPSPPPQPAPAAGGAAAAGSPDESAPAAPARPPMRPAAGRLVAVSVLGPLAITGPDGNQATGGSRKARELIAWLAAHPAGATGEVLGAALWPEGGAGYVARELKVALRKAREMLRTAAGDRGVQFIVLAGERYHLDPALVSVDLWALDAAVGNASAASTPGTQVAALREATSLYRGPLLDGDGYEWTNGCGERIRGRAVGAFARLAAGLAGTDPEQALAVLDAALDHDRYNEPLYQDVMTLQLRLGRPADAQRTLALCESRLGEIDRAPSAATRQAATGHAPSSGTASTG